MIIFIICSVREATPEYRKKLESYVASLTAEGHIVHLPHRDTDQTLSAFDICYTNSHAIRSSDEVHIFYSGASQGTHFDMGVAFALRKPIVVVENEEYTTKKSFPYMLQEWNARSIARNKTRLF